MKQITTSLKKIYVKLYLFKNNNKGQSMFEYALILAIMGLGIIASLSGAGQSLKNTMIMFIDELKNSVK